MSAGRVKRPKVVFVAETVSMPQILAVGGG